MKTKILYILTAVTLSLGLTACGGEKSSSPKDNCPGIDNPLQLDTDLDGKGNACDLDDDGDGFNDNVDPKPLDRTMPGDFSTPEAIIKNPLISNALDEVRKQGIDIRTETAANPPNITGYYSVELGHGTFLATSNGEEIGRGLVGSEKRFSSKSDNTIDHAKVNFARIYGPVSYVIGATGYDISSGSIIRGENNKYTIYSRGKSTCTEAGSDFDQYFINIISGTYDKATGDSLNNRKLWVTIDTEGELTQACADRIAADNEYIGKWAVQSYQLSKRTEPNALLYMCVDENKGYVPTEKWKRNNGSSCSCTNNYTVSCL
jgi:hypothetical protein